MKFVFFGSSEFSVFVLEELLLHNIKPDLIISTLDKPQGRKLVLTPNVVKSWAYNKKIPCLTPVSLKDLDFLAELQKDNWDFFLVASYGKIIPKNIFDLPKYKTLNIHPSLLPKYRGASPIQSQILNDEKDIGISIMEIIEAMDAGPVLIKKKINVSSLVGYRELEKLLAKEGARLLAHILPEWLTGNMQSISQDDDLATYCKKIEKEDGFLDITLDPFENFLKIRAFEVWPKTYFFQNDKRIIVTKADFKDGKLIIEKIIPEGKKEMDYKDFLRGTTLPSP